MTNNIDYSFLRLKSDFEDAKNTNDSPQLQSNLAQYTQVHLCPGETYLQISNNEDGIIFNDNYSVWLVDECNNGIEDVTDRVFIQEFFDTNGIKQIVWEFVNTSDYYMTPLSLRFTNTVNGDTWWTNLFVTTEYRSHLTSRFDYKNYDFHYGTQYNRADYRQSIRLSLYFRNKINESEREEYHEISTDNTFAQRNIKKFKERYILDKFDTFTTERLEILLSSSSIYLDNIKTTSTNPLEFIEPELDSNIAENEMIVSRIYSDTFTFEYQLFDGLQLFNYEPFGLLDSGFQIESLSADANLPLVLNTGTASVYSSDNTLIDTFDETVMVVNAPSTLKITAIGSPVEFLPDGTYYVNLSGGLVSGLGIPNDAINDSTIWTFTLQTGQYDVDQYDNDQYFTGGSTPTPGIFNETFNETFG